MQSLNEAAALQAPNSRCAMLNPFQLQEQLEGVIVRSSSGFPTVVRQHGFDPDRVLLKKRQCIVV